MIKEGAAVIDVGINRVQDPVTAKSKLVGDVDFEGTEAVFCIDYFKSIQCLEYLEGQRNPTYMAELI